MSNDQPYLTISSIHKKWTIFELNFKLISQLDHLENFYL